MPPSTHKLCEAFLFVSALHCICCFPVCSHHPNENSHVNHYIEFCCRSNQRQANGIGNASLFTICIWKDSTTCMNEENTVFRSISNVV